MENKEQDRALQTPAEANRDKHMNYLAGEEQNSKSDTNDREDVDEENSDTSSKDIRNKHDADSGNDSTNQMLQRENLIDPGNEHNHLKDPKARTDDYHHSRKNDADAGSDATGSTGSKPE